MSDTILEVKNLTKYFKTPHGILHAVDGVSFSIERGKTLGIVGESGCGKSTTGRCILRLIEPTSGEVHFEGENILKYNAGQMLAMRQKMQIIFQDPFSSLDPKKTISQTIAEPMYVHHTVPRHQVIDRVRELMSVVGLSERLINSYPHELDGGRRQRIGVARALSVNPEFIVCDEPVSALDVSIQAQILNLLKHLQRQMKLTYIFITHDLSVVNHFSDDIAVMYLGQLVEKAPVDDLFANPVQPYTEALLSAIPVPEVGGPKRERILLKGEITSPINLPDECRFAKRCNYVSEECYQKDPPLQEIYPGHFVACCKAAQFNRKRH